MISLSHSSALMYALSKKISIPGIISLSSSALPDLDKANLHVLNSAFFQISHDLSSFPTPPLVKPRNCPDDHLCDFHLQSTNSFPHFQTILPSAKTKLLPSSLKPLPYLSLLLYPSCSTSPYTLVFSHILQALCHNHSSQEFPPLIISH